MSASMRDQALKTGEINTYRVPRPSESFQGKRELHYNIGISAETVVSKSLHMQIAIISPGARAKAHKHVAHETAIYALRESLACGMGRTLCIIRS
jgi:uncharacterized RmlC-like cupin family protein